MVYLDRQRTDDHVRKIVPRVLDHVKNLDAIECVSGSLCLDRKYDGHFVFAERYPDVNRIKLGLPNSWHAFSHVASQPIDSKTREVIEQFAVACYCKHRLLVHLRQPFRKKPPDRQRSQVQSFRKIAIEWLEDGARPTLKLILPPTDCSQDVEAFV